MKFFGCVCITVASLATFGRNGYRELRSVTVNYLASYQVRRAEESATEFKNTSWRTIIS